MEAKLSFELPEGKDMNEYLYELIKKAEDLYSNLNHSIPYINFKIKYTVFKYFGESFFKITHP